MSSTAAKRGPYAKTRGRLEAIADATLALVEERGHREVSFTDVAERAGLTEAQVLYHFPSKDHLFMAALDRADAVVSAREIAAGPGVLTVPVEAVEEQLVAFVRSGMGSMHVRRLYAEVRAAAVDPEHPANAYVRDHQRIAAANYALYLGALKRAGYAHPDVDPERFGRQLVALWEGLETQWLIDPSFDLAREVGQALRIAARRDEMT
ncbi:TetR/AcrR family transcriptional regulator [Demequina silvatica]|uniref:TetR/AcrR family transcriptional regulator n=1 Tax=Demequina silvatica TaxID=1638988 RepID=UPI000AB0765B|nr:TetR/AcrR family transcriptional regulator [Demequina silvatica]